MPENPLRRNRDQRQPGSRENHVRHSWLCLHQRGLCQALPGQGVVIRCAQSGFQCDQLLAAQFTWEHLHGSLIMFWSDYQYVNQA